MKMMRRTRTTSTSGVTLISDLGPSPPPISMLDSLLVRFLLGDEADALEPAVLDHPHDVLDVTEVQGSVGLDEDVLVRRALADLLHLRFEVLRGEPLRVDEDGLVGLREHHGLALLEHRRHDHEDDEENEAHVDERRHVDVALHALTAAEAIHSHELNSSLLRRCPLEGGWRDLC